MSWSLRSVVGGGTGGWSLVRRGLGRWVGLSRGGEKVERIVGVELCRLDGDLRIGVPGKRFHEKWRVFSEEAPKGFGGFGKGEGKEEKNSEKGTETKSERMGGSGGGGGTPDPKWLRQVGLLAMFVFAALMLGSNVENPRKEISFQNFLWDLLFAGKVEKVEVSVSGDENWRAKRGEG